MEEDGGRLHEHGPGPLQQGIQGEMRRPDVQLASVQADEVVALMRAVEHVFDLGGQAGMVQRMGLPARLMTVAQLCRYAIASRAATTVSPMASQMSPAR